MPVYPRDAAAPPSPAACRPRPRDRLRRGRHPPGRPAAKEKVVQHDKIRQSSEWTSASKQLSQLPHIAVIKKSEFAHTIGCACLPLRRGCSPAVAPPLMPESRRGGDRALAIDLPRKRRASEKKHESSRQRACRDLCPNPFAAGSNTSCNHERAIVQALPLC